MKTTRVLVDFLGPSETVCSSWRRFAPSYKTEVTATRAVLKAYPGAEVVEVAQTTSAVRKVAKLGKKTVAVMTILRQEKSK